MSLPKKCLVDTNVPKIANLATKPNPDSDVSDACVEVIGRFISRAEALRIARKILEQAERERLIFAEYEAARGIQWENHP